MSSIEHDVQPVSVDDVELLDFRTQSLEKQVELASQHLEELGFVALRPDGVTQALIEELQDTSNRFFDQPADRKHRFTHRQHYQGEYGIHGYFHNLDTATGSARKEHFNVNPVHNSGEAWSRLGNSNLMVFSPADQLTIAQAYQRFNRIACHAAKILLHGVGLNSSSAFDKEPSGSLIRAIRYSGDDGAGGTHMTTHTDLNVVSLLPPLPTPGLRYPKTDGQTIEPDGTFAGESVLLHVGESMGDFSNGRLKAAPHYVHNADGTARTSLVYFHHAAPEQTEGYYDEQGAYRSRREALWGDRILQRREQTVTS